MGKTLTLDALREQIETKYGPLVIDMGQSKGGPAFVRMLPILRLPRERRDMVTRLFAELKDVDNDDLNASVDVLGRIVRTVCETDKQADALLEALGDDGQALQEVFTEYQAVTGLGDPKPSES